jgi:hypothetical protein
VTGQYAGPATLRLHRTQQTAVKPDCETILATILLSDEQQEGCNNRY